MSLDMSNAFPCYQVVTHVRHCPTEGHCRDALTTSEANHDRASYLSENLVVDHNDRCMSQLERGVGKVEQNC
jgi:hypothetical protein